MVTVLRCCGSLCSEEKCLFMQLDTWEGRRVQSSLQSRFYLWEMLSLFANTSPRVCTPTAGRSLLRSWQHRLGLGVDADHVTRRSSTGANVFFLTTAPIFIFFQNIILSLIIDHCSTLNVLFCKEYTIAEPIRRIRKKHRVPCSQICFNFSLVFELGKQLWKHEWSFILMQCAVILST